MAFSSTSAWTAVRKGTVEIVVTVNDTAGSSAGLITLADAESIAIQAAVTGTAGTVTVDGSNDGVTFAGLPTALSFAGAGVAAFAANNLGFYAYRFTLAGGDATTAWTLRLSASSRRR